MDAYQKHEREALQSLAIKGAPGLFRRINEGGGDIYATSEV
jgi:hypothetical protein